MGTVKDKENAKMLQKRNDLCYQSRKRAIIYTELILSVSTGEVQKTEKVHTNEFLLVMMHYNVLNLERFLEWRQCWTTSTR